VTDQTDPVEGECPRCGSGKTIAIVYGLPGDELVLQLEYEEIELGGCCMYAGAPTRRCTVCGLAFGALELRSVERDV
jgi:hypothetical protein